MVILYYIIVLNYYIIVLNATLLHGYFRDEIGLSVIHSIVKSIIKFIHNSVINRPISFMPVLAMIFECCMAYLTSLWLHFHENQF